MGRKSRARVRKRIMRHLSEEDKGYAKKIFYYSNLKICNRKRSYRNKELLQNYKTKNNRCTCCDRTYDPISLDLHHRDPDQKTKDLNDILSIWKTEKVQEEIDKCDILCANCHLIKHNNPGLHFYRYLDDNEIKFISDLLHSSKTSRERVNIRGRWKLSRDAYAMKTGTKCKICGEGRPRCLVFHHTKDKKYNIWDLIGNGRKIRFLEEIKKCEIICSNCHRLLHKNDPNIDHFL